MPKASPGTKATSTSSKAIFAKAATRDDGYEITADQVVVTNGGKQAIFNTMATLINPGDENLEPE